MISKNCSREIFKPLPPSVFQQYHDSFHGDTYDACMLCGGKCEMHKISTLLPGEKEYIAQSLDIPLKSFEDEYLDAVDTPYGCVDVLKMKDGCQFLDTEYRCTVVKAKPILCDIYPIVFTTDGRKVWYEIDQRDCPMVHWKKYERVVKDFETAGIRAVERLPVPYDWWKAVMIFDEFDFDYKRIEKEMRYTDGYQEFLIEDLLGYTCNGYERNGRIRGLNIMEQRIDFAIRVSLSEIDSITGVRLLKSAYMANLKGDRIDALQAIKNLRVNQQVPVNSNNDRYMVTAKFTQYSVEQILRKKDSYRIRLADAAKAAKVRKQTVSSRPIYEVAKPYRSTKWNRLDGISTFEVLDWKSRDAIEGYALLAKHFGPDEIDGPLTARYLRGDSTFRSHVSNAAREGGGPFMHRWIMVIARNEKGNLVGATDGALIANEHLNVFYASHIATSTANRSKGLGTWLSSAILQAADDVLSDASREKYGDFSPKTGSGKARILGELGEVEFPNLMNDRSVSRLYFHERIGREVIWPLRYSQSDTDYRQVRFDQSQWNTVPMFLCYRNFTDKPFDVGGVVESANLLYDHFHKASNPEGIERDRNYMVAGIKKYGPPRQVGFPKNRGELRVFIKKTGTLPSILLSLYPNHKYTLDRIEVLGYMQKVEENLLDYT